LLLLFYSCNLLTRSLHAVSALARQKTNDKIKHKVTMHHLMIMHSLSFVQLWLNKGPLLSLPASISSTIEGRERLRAAGERARERENIAQRQSALTRTQSPSGSLNSNTNTNIILLILHHHSFWTTTERKKNTVSSPFARLTAIAIVHKAKPRPFCLCCASHEIVALEWHK